MSLNPDQEIAESIARRLRELGVSATEEEIGELASAYPALVAWMRIAEGLAGAGDSSAPETDSP